MTQANGDSVPAQLDSAALAGTWVLDPARSTVRSPAAEVDRDGPLGWGPPFPIWRSPVLIAVACVVILILVFTAGAFAAGH